MLFKVILLTVLLISQCRTATITVGSSGQHKTVSEAVNAASSNSVIKIEAGIYREYIHVPNTKKNLSFVGAGADKTILEFGKYASQKDEHGNEIGTFATASVFVEADDFTASDLTFKNTAGKVGQALAVRLDGDRGVYRDCRFVGYQDTILANKGRHYFSNCYIEGAVDFIFGAATLYCQSCRIHATANGYITAASTDQYTKFGFVFHQTSIDGAPGVATYLGRPWRPYADVYYLHCQMSGVVKREGWDNWRNASNEKTARYYEYGSTGAGAVATGRANWAHTLTAAEAEAITAHTVLGGSDGWNPK